MPPIICINGINGGGDASEIQAAGFSNPSQGVRSDIQNGAGELTNLARGTALSLNNPTGARNKERSQGSICATNASNSMQLHLENRDFQRRDDGEIAGAMGGWEVGGGVPWRRRVPTSYY